MKIHYSSIPTFSRIIILVVQALLSIDPVPEHNVHTEH